MRQDGNGEIWMKQLILGLLEISAVAHDASSLGRALENLAEQFGFLGYGYVKPVPGDFYMISNLDPEWIKRSKTYALSRQNPILRRAQQLCRAFIWSGALQVDQMTDGDSSFYETASHYEIRSGITFPIAIANGAISMLSFVSAMPVLTVQEEIDPIVASSAVGQLHAHIEHLKIASTPQEPFYLTPKEGTYTRWLSLGKTVEDTADIEQVKYNTVRIALAEARRRYDLCNNTQLVAQAIRRGLI